MVTQRNTGTHSENRRESGTRIDGQPDRRHENNGQGAVKDPAHDGRLVENMESGTSISGNQNDSNDSNRSDNRSRQQQR